MSSRESISITSGFVRIMRDVTDVTSYTIEGHSQINVTLPSGKGLVGSSIVRINRFIHCSLTLPKQDRIR